MKKLQLILLFSIISTGSVKAQECDIQIQVLEDRYMFGTASKLSSDPSSKKLEVDFTSEYMEIILPVEGENYLIKVVNESCQAYCSREKRVRQLHSGDEKLVRNLLKDKMPDILEQLKSCDG
jgi:hypothetical protein